MRIAALARCHLFAISLLTACAAEPYARAGNEANKAATVRTTFDQTAMAASLKAFLHYFASLRVDAGGSISTPDQGWSDNLREQVCVAAKLAWIFTKAPLQNASAMAEADATLLQSLGVRTPSQPAFGASLLETLASRFRIEVSAGPPRSLYDLYVNYRVTCGDGLPMRLAHQAFQMPVEYAEDTAETLASMLDQALQKNGSNLRAAALHFPLGPITLSQPGWHNGKTPAHLIQQHDADENDFVALVPDSLEAPIHNFAICDAAKGFLEGYPSDTDVTTSGAESSTWLAAAQDQADKTQRLERRDAWIRHVNQIEVSATAPPNRVPAFAEGYVALRHQLPTEAAGSGLQAFPRLSYKREHFDEFVTWREQPTEMFDVMIRESGKPHYGFCPTVADAIRARIHRLASR